MVICMEQWLKERLETIPKESKILEIGCFEGQLLEELDKMGFKNLEYTDLKDYLWKSKKFKKFKACNLNTQKLPYSNNSLDLIICQYVLEHIENTFSFFREAYRVLKNNGRLIVSVPNGFTIFEKMNFLLTSNFIRWNYANDHINLFTPAIISKAIKEKFKLDRKYYSYGIFPILRFKLPAVRAFGRYIHWEFKKI